MSPCGLPIERRRALLALVLGTVVLGSCAGGPRITEPPLTAPTVGTPSAQASHGDPSAASRSTEPVSTAVRFALGDWEPVPPAGPLGDVAVNDIIPAGDGYVAVGCEFSAIAEWRECAVPAAWQVGSDGSWSRADVPPARGGSIDVVVRADQGFIAGGQVVLGDPMTEIRAAFWTSRDGRRWDRVPDRDQFSNASVTDLFAWQGGFIASGFGAHAYGEAAGVKLWRSEGGNDWTPIEADFGDVLEAGVAPYWNGLIMWGPLGGGVCGPCRQTVWLSEDAETWTRVPDQPSFDGAWISSIVESGQELVAVGSVGSVQGPRRAAIWVSRDGREWQQLQPPQEGDSHARRFLATDAGPLVLGTARFGEEPRLVSWVSPPGPRWQWAFEPVDRELPQVDMLAAIGVGPEGIIAVLHPRADLLERAPEVWRRRYVEPGE